MPRSRIASRRQSPAPASRPLAALAGCVLAALPVCLALAGPARAGAGSERHSSGGLPVSLAITSVSPAFATHGQTVTVRGSVTNTSRTAISGISVQLRSSSVPFSSRDALQRYADGNQPLADSVEPGAITHIGGRLAPDTTARWKIALPVRKVQMTSFGVYPLAAEADSAAGVALAGGTSRTFLPYWPRKHGRYPRPRRQDIGWIWPLIDRPRQDACQQFLDNSQAASLAPGGRLFSLLAAARAGAVRGARLTWAIDPSVLVSVRAMSHPYRVGSSPQCRGSRQLPASHAAAAWLAGLKSATRNQPVFVTPYADVDVAALTQGNLETDLVYAFTSGRLVASSILGRNFSTQPADRSSQAAAEQLNGMAWPADGLASHAVLENLAVNKVTTVILDSLIAPPPAGQTSVTPASVVTSTPDGVNGDMRVLLSDDTITRILALANSPSQRAAATFAVEQRFLAETAMIAQLPNASRAMVIAPPRRWNPPAGLAQGLLAETVKAPWLRPVSLGQLAARRPGQVQPSLRVPAGGSTRADLGRHLLRRLRSMDRRVRLLGSIRVHPDPALNRAVASVESSSWRGRARGRRAQILLDRLSAYITGQQRALTIIAPLPVTLGGLKGTVPVSISNRLDYAVKVRLKVTVPSNGSISSSQPPVQILGPGNVVNVHLKMKSAQVGSTTVRLSLLTPDGRALPGAPVAMTIRATHFGTLALVILAAALGVFMITSAARAIRQGRSAPHEGDLDGSGASSAERPAQPGEADSVGAEPADQRAADDTATGDDDPTEDTDELAQAPGRADQG